MQRLMASARDSDSRRAPRSVVGGPLHCSLGRIIDLSADGARISASRLPAEDVVAIEIADEHVCLRCAARVVWHRRSGFFRYEFGVRFPALNEDGAAAIRRLLQNHRFTSEYGAAA